MFPRASLFTHSQHKNQCKYKWDKMYPRQRYLLGIEERQKIIDDAKNMSYSHS